MEFYTLPYRVLFHDTMAYGSHHFLTNFKFQCLIREQLFFDEMIDVSSKDGQSDFGKLVLLTQQGYCRNLAPVKVGEKVGILMSVEEQSLSTARFCFRVIRYDGVPVTCGYQTLVCVSSETGNILPAPPYILKYSERMKEELVEPSFSERVHTGRLKEVFNENIISMGVAVANEHTGLHGKRFITADGRNKAHAEERKPASHVFAKGDNDVVFLFPGQGSYSPKALTEFYHSDTDAARLLVLASDMSERILGIPFLPLITSATQSQHDALLGRFPDLSNIGLYLGSVISAHAIMKMGIEPAVVIGHSLGEYAALTIAGVMSAETGIEAICHRIQAIRSAVREPGGMLAVFASIEQVVKWIDDSLPGSSLQVSVINHETQVVVSGTLIDIGTFESTLKLRGIRSARLQSRYPFHSKLMQPSVDVLARELARLPLSGLNIPVYSPIERRFYTDGDDIAAMLSSHLTRPLSFPDAIRSAYAGGIRNFVELGGGDVLGKLTAKILCDCRDISIRSPFAQGSDLVSELGKSVSGILASKESSLKHGEIPSQDIGRGAGKKLAISHNENADSRTDQIFAHEPIAIVSMGCVLPEASSPEEFWENILSGKSGIYDAGHMNQDLKADFLSEGGVVPDKTYTLLGGFVRDFEPDMAMIPYSMAEMTRLTTAQRFLAFAMGQCLAGMRKENTVHANEIGIVLGSTGDGCVEYDESLLVSSIHHEIDSLDLSDEISRKIHRHVDGVYAHVSTKPAEISPYESYCSVSERFLGKSASVLAVDAACASSLYAIDIGIERLRRGDCRLALCGGVFAPGPANSCLFSQFRGLSATGSRPLDASADGVIFGEGSVVIALKRLSDAQVDGDRIHAVIRGCGLSNDGKSPSVAEPRKRGQVMALRRAYSRENIHPDSIQYIEAHATATPVGDSVEFSALKEVFSERDSKLPKISIGSVKSLVGHTGWLAGAASLMKVVEALKSGTIPPQKNFSQPNPSFDLPASPFNIQKSAAPWAKSSDGSPRRAGVNGFGFGGSNAHLIVEEYNPEIHRSPRLMSKPEPDVRSVIVGVGARFPFESGDLTREKTSISFDRSKAKLPKGMLVMPDVMDHMDLGQILACTAAHDALKPLGDKWKVYREEIGVVLGVAGKTGYGITVNKRIYRDSLRRKLLAQADPVLVPDISRLLAGLDKLQPSGPYTLPGIMPNVTAGRVANLLDLNGPNFTLDAGAGSLYEAILTGQMLLSSGKCKMILVGAVSGYAGPQAQSDDGRSVAEGVMVLALTSREFAIEHDMEILADVIVETHAGSIGADEHVKSCVGSFPHLAGAEGAIEIMRILDAVRKGESGGTVVWSNPQKGSTHAMTFGGAKWPVKNQAAENDAAIGIEESDRQLPVPSGIGYCTPRLVPVSVVPVINRRPIGKVLLLVDDDNWKSLQGISSFIKENAPIVICPLGRDVEGATAIDISSDQSLVASLGEIHPAGIDTILLIKNLAHEDALQSVIADAGIGGGLLDLLFGAVRQCHDRVRKKEISVGAILTGSISSKQHPYAGLISGFMKSIARELPGSICKVISTDVADIKEVISQLQTEFASGPLPAVVESIYSRGKRYEYRLERFESLSKQGSPELGPGSVVVATGGARGVTAVLIEEVMRTYGCHVVLLGRTDTSKTPDYILAMDDAAFNGHESKYYSEEMKGAPGTRIVDLKRRYESFRNAREIKDTLSRLSVLPGSFEYILTDILDKTSVDNAFRRISQKYGRLDMIIHGAGLQSSKSTARKKLEEFRGIVSTKIGGLSNLCAACDSYFSSNNIYYHLITSVFSYFGNDGQPDYGAANEAMNRIADYYADSDVRRRWTAMAWLGWAGVGMTRGAEYETLARTRKLTPVTRDEGQRIFAELMKGPPVARQNFLISQGEISFYDVKMLSDSSMSHTSGVGIQKTRDLFEKTVDGLQCSISLASHPYLNDHLVNTRPTYPGSFEIEMVCQAVSAYYPDHHILSLESTKLTRFIKVSSEKGFVGLRSRLAEIPCSGPDVLVRVSLLSDFIHASGAVLEKDILHFETVVRLSSENHMPDRIDMPASPPDTRLVDPYVHHSSPVRLKGLFECLSEIKAGPETRQAIFRIRNTEMIQHLEDFRMPAVLVDAMFRFSMICQDEDGNYPIFVPINCEKFYLTIGVNDFHLAMRSQPIRLQSSNPRIDGDSVTNEWVQAIDHNGHVIAMARGLVARKFGFADLTQTSIVNA